MCVARQITVHTHACCVYNKYLPVGLSILAYDTFSGRVCLLIESVVQCTCGIRRLSNNNETNASNIKIVKYQRNVLAG